MKLAYVLVGMLLGAAVAVAVWPSMDRPPVAEEDEQQASVKEIRTGPTDLLQAVNEARTPGERYRSLEALGSLRVGGIQKALEAMDVTGKGHDLGDEAKALLVYWAQRDPVGALEWSWMNLRTSQRWETAANEILETWIASQDHAALEFLAEVEKRENSLAVDEASDPRQIFLSRDQMEKVRLWIYFYDDQFARLANEQGIHQQSRFPRPTVFADRIENSSEIEEAFRYWKNAKNGWMICSALKDRAKALGLDDLDLGEPPKYSYQANVVTDPSPLMLIWSEAGKDLAKAIAGARELPPEKRHVAYLIMFDSWKAAHPGKTPAFDELPAEARMIWKDLSNLPAVEASLSLHAY